MRHCKIGVERFSRDRTTSSYHARSFVDMAVEAEDVTNVAVEANGWDLRLGKDGGCGVAGCDPRLTRVSRCKHL